MPTRGNRRQTFQRPQCADMPSATIGQRSRFLVRGLHAVDQERNPAQWKAAKQENDEQDDTILVETEEDFITFWHNTLPSLMLQNDTADVSTVVYRPFESRPLYLSSAVRLGRSRPVRDRTMPRVR
jgi:hypothetical protein